MSIIQVKTKQPRALLIFKLIAVPAIILAVIFFYDVTFPNHKKYDVTITKIEKKQGRSGIGYKLYLTGENTYHVGVDSNFSKEINVGDKAKVELSSILGVVNNIEISKGENTYLRNKGGDSKFLFLLGVLYSTAILAFTHGLKFYKNICFVVGNIIISITACIQLLLLSLKIL